VTDGYRLILNFFDAIQMSVAHIYHTALVFSPKTALLDAYSARELHMEARITHGRQTEWTSLLRTIQAPGSVYSVRYSYDGSMLAVAGLGFSQLFQSGTGERVAELEFDCGLVRSVSFSCNDKMLATASGNTIRVWKTNTGSLITTLAANYAYIRSVDFHPHIDHLLVAGCVYGEVYVWDVTKSSIIASFNVPNSSGILCWMQQDAQKHILIGTKRRAEIWNVDPFKQVNVFSVPSSDAEISAVASSCDGLLVASGSEDGTVVIYDAYSANIIHSYQYSRGVVSVAFSSVAAILAFGSFPETLGFFFYDDNAPNRIITWGSHQGYSQSAVFSPNGRFFASGSNDGMVNIWETSAVKSVQNNDHHSQRIRRVRLSNNNQLIASSSDDTTVKVWNALTGALCTTLHGHSAGVRDAIILRDGIHAVSVDMYQTLILWDWPEGKILDRNVAIAREHDSFGSIFSYSREILTPGFISTHGSLGDSKAFRVCCWNVDLSEGGDIRIILVAHGAIHPIEHILRITHRVSIENANLSLWVECESGAQYSAAWHGPSMLAGPPEELQFIEVTEDSHIKDDDDALSTLDAPCRKSDDKVWFLDHRDRRILWVPPLHRGGGFWHGRRLVIQGDSGRLTVVDFSNVDLDNDTLF
jgi:WD40 repeat protein